ncbi:MAG: hypothetical protein K2X57_21875 [Xanthobacteraceae bacterium]|nr:hypothetical protein [Xanthobacteraceae bacterium]
MGKHEKLPAGRPGRPALRVAAGRQVVVLPEGYPIHWPEPEPGQKFDDVVSAIPVVEDMFNECAHAVVLDLMQQGVPDWLTASDLRHASEVLLELCRHYPDRSPVELLWTLASDAFRPGLEGRPATWSAHEGRELVELVDAGLSAMGLRRDNKKGLRAVIAVIRERSPNRFGKISADTLRLAYYKAKRSVAKRG